MEALDELRIGTVYTVGLSADEDIKPTSVVLYNRQTNQAFEATSVPYIIEAGSVADVSWDATSTLKMSPGVYSIQVYINSGAELTCVLDKECVRAKIVSASNTK